MEQWEIDLRERLNREIPDGTYDITGGNGARMYTGKGGRIEFEVAMHALARTWKEPSINPKREKEMQIRPKIRLGKHTIIPRLPIVFSFSRDEIVKAANESEAAWRRKRRAELKESVQERKYQIRHRDAYMEWADKADYIEHLLKIEGNKRLIKALQIFSKPRLGINKDRFGL